MPHHRICIFDSDSRPLQKSEARVLDGITKTSYFERARIDFGKFSRAEKVNKFKETIQNIQAK